jgi:hypothetical protein
MGAVRIADGERTANAERADEDVMLALFPWTTRCEAKATRTPSARSVRAAAGAAPARARRAPRAAKRIRDAGALTDTSIDLRVVASVPRPPALLVVSMVGAHRSASDPSVE